MLNLSLVWRGYFAPLGLTRIAVSIDSYHEANGCTAIGHIHSKPSQEALCQATPVSVYTITGLMLNWHDISQNHRMAT